MTSKNKVVLVGKLKFPEVKEIGAGFSKFSGKISVPAEYFFDDGEVSVTTTDIKLVAWFDLADSLGEVPAGSTIKVVGHLQERQYDGKCNHCGAKQKKYWADVLVVNFVVIDE